MYKTILKVVVSHDDDFQRICGQEGQISCTNYCDLPPIRDAQNLTFMKDFIVSRPSKWALIIA